MKNALKNELESVKAENNWLIRQWKQHPIKMILRILAVVAAVFTALFVGGLATAGKLIPLKAIFAMQKAIALKDRHSKGDLRYYSNYQPDYLYVTLHKDWCEEVIDAPFEDTTLMIPKGWDPVLKEIYGNYMQLPPEEQRIPTHSSLQIQVYDE